MKPSSRLRLEAREHEALVEAAGTVETPRVVEAAPQDPVLLRRRCARVREADVRVERDELAVRVVGVVDHVGLVAAADRRARHLVPPDDRLLLRQARPVPRLDEHSDDAHRLVGTADCPPGLTVVAPDPDQLAHPRLVGGVGVRGAVLEPEQVAGAGVARLRDRADRVRALLHPPQREPPRVLRRHCRNVYMAASALAAATVSDTSP